jgi:CRP-like cAMP-binding protein
MNLNEEVEILKRVPLFAKIELARLKLIAFTGERMSFGSGQEVCHQGEPGDAMYVILGGVADVLIDTPDGPLRVAQLRKNGFFGETAILCDAPRNATITASESLLTLKISKEMFYRLVDEFPSMAVEMMRELAHRVDDINQKLSETNQKLREATANKAA